MRIVFNDLSELTVQSVILNGDYVEVKTISAQPDELRELFEDESKTRKMRVYERDDLLATYSA